VSRVGSQLLAGTAAGAVAWLGNRTAVRRGSAATGSRWVRTNHAGLPVTLAEGPIAAAALLAGLGVGALAGAPDRQSGSRILAVAVAGAGAGLVGAYDDLFGSGASRGFRGHLRALRQGTVTSGLVKIIGVGLSGLTASMIIRSGRPGRFSIQALVETMIDTALIAGTANLVNLFDLRPGRAAKIIVIMSAPLSTVGAAPVLGAAIGSLPSDLAARSMMGDCGANALGAAVATVAVDVLPRPARLVALGAVATLNLASERVSFTAVIARTPWLRAVDELGRRSPPAGPPAPAGPG